MTSNLELILEGYFPVSDFATLIWNDESGVMIDCENGLIVDLGL